jgi:hypothetical protein
MELQILSLRTQSENYNDMASTFNELFPSHRRSYAAIRQKYQSLLQSTPGLSSAADLDPFSRNLIIRIYLGGVTLIGIKGRSLPFPFKEGECTISQLFKIVGIPLGYDCSNPQQKVSLLDINTRATICIRHDSDDSMLIRFLEIKTNILSRKAHGLPLRLVASLLE